MKRKKLTTLDINTLLVDATKITTEMLSLKAYYDEVYNVLEHDLNTISNEIDKKKIDLLISLLETNVINVSRECNYYFAGDQYITNILLIDSKNYNGCPQCEVTTININEQGEYKIETDDLSYKQALTLVNNRYRDSNKMIKLLSREEIIDSIEKTREKMIACTNKNAHASIKFLKGE